MHQTHDDEIVAPGDLVEVCPHRRETPLPELHPFDGTRGRVVRIHETGSSVGTTALVEVEKPGAGGVRANPVVALSCLKRIGPR